MTTATQRPMSSTPREKKPLEPVNPAVSLRDYDFDTGVGVCEIDGTVYLMTLICDGGKRVGMRLTRYDEKAENVKRHDVEFDGWRCDCEDATYRSERPGGCKHVVALRDQVAPVLRCRRAERNQGR